MEGRQVIEMKVEKPPDFSGNVVRFLVKWTAFMG
jgi:hypothetical protein